MDGRYKQNISGKPQVIWGWPESTVVAPGDWVRAELAEKTTPGTFSEAMDMGTFSYPVEKRDAHGNVIRVLVPAVPADQTKLGEVVEHRQPLFTVVVPVYGRHDCLEECLAGVSAATMGHPVEVIVVDDKPDEPVEEVPDQVRLVRSPETRGFAGACNAGAREARGDWVVFLNSDVVPRGDWLGKMLRTAQKMMAGVVGARMVYPGAGGKTQHAGMFRSSDGLYVHRLRDLPMGDKRVCVDRHLEAVSGACMMVSARAWKALGGFCEDFGKGYFEDVDLCLRWLAVGGRVAYCGTTTVLHLEGASQGKRTVAWRRRLERSAEVFRGKWPAERIDEVTAGYPWAPEVDIVVPVHNAARQTFDCVKSIEKRTPGWINWKLTVVDDGSDSFTAATLDGFPGGRVRVLRGEGNVGYLPSVQHATEQTLGKWLCYVNSDVVVTDGWLAKLLSAAEGDPRIKIVNPLSNRASHVSVPMPPGSNYVDMNERLSKAPKREVWDVASPIGYCMLVERAALEECGGWDVAYYGRGYGEECDLWMRMLQRGYRCVVTDDCYVLHEGGATFSQFGPQQVQERAGYEKFMARWAQQAKPRLAEFNRLSPQRRALPSALVTPTGRRQVVFVINNNVELCGGVLACVHVANRLIEKGWNASFACTRIARPVLEKLGARFEPLTFQTRGDLVDGLRKELRSGAFIVATLWFSVADVLKVCAGRPDLKPVYFVQDVEYMFRYPNNNVYSDEREVVATYSAFDRMVVNSDWVLETVRGHLGDPEAGHKIGIGVDTKVFYPGDKSRDRVRVMAHCRPSTPRRGWDVISKAVVELKRRHGAAVEVVVYDQPSGNVPVDKNLGKVSSAELARWMRSAHVFLEGSHFQGWGMQALEAMASGCALVSTANRGIDNFGTHGHDCVIVPPGVVEPMVSAASLLVSNPEERTRLAANARETAEYFDWNNIRDEWDHVLRSWS